MFYHYSYSQIPEWHFQPNVGIDQKLKLEGKQTRLKKQEVVDRQNHSRKERVLVYASSQTGDNIALCESAWSDLWPAAAASLGWWRLINTEAAAFETSQVLIRERENLVFHPGQIKWQSSPSGDVTKYSGWCNKS